jgi:hypothetical protein
MTFTLHFRNFRNYRPKAMLARKLFPKSKGINKKEQANSPYAGTVKDRTNPSL